MWAVIVGGLAILGAVAWLRYVAPVRTLVRYLDAGTEGIRISRADVIRWPELREISVETTAGGPWFEDFYLVLVSDGRRPVRVPDPLVPAILPAVQRLPNFDNETLIRATGSTEKAKFLCWTRGTVASS
jgi:hypothetical protein